MMQHTQKKVLESILNSEIILRTNLDTARNNVSEEVIQDEYQKCCDDKDIKRAKKLYKLFDIPPDEFIREESIDSYVKERLPIKFDCLGPSKIKIYNVNEVNSILKIYSPTFPLGLSREEIDFSDLGIFEDILDNFGMSLRATSHVKDAKELYKGLAKQYHNQIKPGYQYSMELPIVQNQNIIGEYIGKPFIMTNFILDSKKL